jgi:hypothetical protein
MTCRTAGALSRGADVSNAPTAHRAQHVAGIEAPQVDALAFRQGWRIASRLDVLRRTGRLTPGQWQSAVEYRAAWERARLEASTTMRLMRGGGGDSDSHARLLAGIGTVAKLSAVESAIGRLRADLCRACIVHDLPWAVLARRLHHDRETVRDWTVLAIVALASAWSAPQRRQRLQPHAGAGQRPGAV